MTLVPRLTVFIFLEALFAIVTMALAIGLRQNFMGWPMDVRLLFASSLTCIILPFVTHMINTSEDLVKSPRQKMWLFLAAFVQFAGFGLLFAAFVYGLVEDLNGRCEAEGINGCVVVRTTLAFDCMVWILYLVGTVLIVLHMATPPKKNPLDY